MEISSESAHNGLKIPNMNFQGNGNQMLSSGKIKGHNLRQARFLLHLMKTF